MEEREARNRIQCIVDEGIVLDRRDMVRVLRDLGHVRYEDRQDGRVRARGEGFIASVFANGHASTIFVNRRLYINVNAFSHMQLTRIDDDETAIDLVDDRRTIRLLPVGDGLTERQAFIAESAVVTGPGALERMLNAEHAEAFFDDEQDDLDG